MSRSTTNLVLARFISRSGGEAAFFVGIWGKAAFEFEANAPQLAVLMGALAVASLIGSTLSGLAIDRLGPKRVLIVGEIAFVPVALSALLATDMRSLSVVAGFIGLVGAPVYTAIASFPPFLASDVNRLTKINAHVETAGMAALVAGTAIGAAIAEWGDLDWIFVFDAATSVVGAMLVLPMTLRRVESTSGEHGAFAESLRGFSIVYRHNRLRFYVLAGTAVWILFGMFGALEPLFYRDVLDATPSTIGWVNAILGVGLILGTTAASRLSEPWRTARFLTWLVSGIGVAAVIYVATDSLAVVTAGGFLWGLLIGVLAPLLRTLIHVNTPEGAVGRVMGANQVHADGAKLALLGVAPILANRFGVQETLVACGVVLMAAAAAFVPHARALDRTRTVPVPPVGASKVSDEPLSPNP